jgi:predicted MPP superfamily phosphohydrolase
MSSLEIGCARALRLREEEVGGGGDGGIGAEAWRLCYASDLHFTARRAHLVERLREVIGRAAPDAILLGGDLLDRANGAGALARCVAELGTLAPVFAVAGNHDGWVGGHATREAVHTSGGHWLHDGDVVLRSPGRRALHLVASTGVAAVARALRVFVGHDPAVFPRAAASGCELVFAGHLHGGQCTLWERGGRQYPGAFLSRWNGLRFECHGSTLLVSRGVADTLPIRFRCPREVLLCRVS